MSQYDELKRLAEASRVANHDERGPDEAFQGALHPEVVLALIAENESLSLKHAEAGRLYLELAAERDQLKADKEALVAAYARAGEREHELRVERSTLREAVKFAASTFKTITSSDGSGHADLAEAVLRIAGPAMGEGEES